MIDLGIKIHFEDAVENINTDFLNTEKQVVFLFEQIEGIKNILLELTFNCFDRNIIFALIEI